MTTLFFGDGGGGQRPGNGGSSSGGRRRRRRCCHSSSSKNHDIKPTKWKLSVIVRTFYWVTIFLLVLSTFLRTSLVVVNDSVDVDAHANGNHNHNVVHWAEERQRASLHQGSRKKSPGIASSTTATATASTGSSKKQPPHVVPGMHNLIPPELTRSITSQHDERPREEAAKQHLDIDDDDDDDDDQVPPVKRHILPARRPNDNNSTMNVERERARRQSDLEQQSSRPTEGSGSVTSTDLNADADKKVDWWSVVQKFHNKPQARVDVDEDKTIPRSVFVEHLYQLKDDIMRSTVSNTTGYGSSHSRPNNPRSTAWSSTKLAQPPSNQPVQFLSPILPAPTLVFQNVTTTNYDENNGRAKIVVLVLSHQGSFIKRQAIRETWAKNHSSSVLFVVAQSDCRQFEHDLDGTNNDDGGGGGGGGGQRRINSTDPIHDNSQMKPTNKSLSTTTSCQKRDHDFLRMEQSKYQDLLEIPIMEDYRSLPEKVLQAYHWVFHNRPDVEWIVKSDDDMMVRIPSLERYLRKYNPSTPMVVGDIIYHSTVARDGKWAENDYRPDYYPYWPRGSAGHAVSRATVRYFSQKSPLLRRYQGEDVSIGIWLHKARKKKYGGLNDVTYIHAKHTFTNGGKDACQRPKYMSIGHDFRPDALLECHEKYDSLFAENAWLDDPSEFQDIIRQEQGFLGQEQGYDKFAHDMGWQPSIGYNKEGGTGIREGLTGPGVGSGNGYRGDASLFAMQ